MPMRLALSALLLFAAAAPALAWGSDGHAVVAEIAQRRLSPQAQAMVERLLGKGHSLASVASWPDDIRDARPETYNWHFVDMPLAIERYNAERDCKANKDKGDCIVAELDRLRSDLRCAATAEKRAEALKFAVHFLGDLHQPLHTVDEYLGGNQVKVDVFMRGLTCTGKCEPEHIASNFHKAWDEDLIRKVVWNFGAYAERLESGWLTSAEARQESPDGGQPALEHATIVGWAEETHRAAGPVWTRRPADNTLDDRYLRDVLPVLDRQLGVAGLRLARFLNQAYASEQCPLP